MMNDLYQYLVIPHQQERIERERIKEAEEAGLFARPEKLSNATEDAREVAEVLSSTLALKL